MRMTEEQFAALVKERDRWAKKVDPAPQAAPPAPAKKTPKYRNTRTARHGIKFDSIGEADRWDVLKAREIAGEISRLRHHVRFALVVEGVHICDYEADFVYIEGAAEVVEDWKSPPTRERRDYQIKRRLMQACHRIEIKEMSK